jgi:hypothetical protein
MRGCRKTAVVKILAEASISWGSQHIHEKVPVELARKFPALHKRVPIALNRLNVLQKEKVW